PGGSSATASETRVGRPKKKKASAANGVLDLKGLLVVDRDNELFRRFASTKVRKWKQQPSTRKTISGAELRVPVWKSGQVALIVAENLNLAQADSFLVVCPRLSFGSVLFDRPAAANGIDRRDCRAAVANLSAL